MARDDLEDFDPSTADPEDPEGFRNLRTYADRKAKEASKVPSLEKENAMLRAGVDTSTRMGQAFMQTYEGKLDDPAAILEDAMDFNPAIIRGQVPPPASVPPTVDPTADPQADPNAAPPPPEPTGSTARQALADGAIPSAAAVEDVRNASIRAAEKGLKEGKTWEAAVGDLVHIRAQGVKDGTFAAVDAYGRVINTES